MPSVSSETLQKLDRLTKEHGIEFAGDLPTSKWPRYHKETLGRAKQLGERKFDSFAIAPNIATDEPWKIEVKSQAVRLMEKARRNRQRNESSWSKNCRKRVWRSEIEAIREDTSAAAESLQRRQQNREPCRCTRLARNRDVLEAVGLNRIFGHREDEQVQLDREVAQQLHKDIQKPDTIFGLRQTRNIENLLHDTRRRELENAAADKGKQLHELLSPSPLSQPISARGDELLFPFLVLEAKSGTSASDWYSIQMQTAFPIKAFLDTQERLRKAAGVRSKWSAGPLVWFFSNKGEDWRLSAAYMSEEHPGLRSTTVPNYQIADIWHGSIGTRDGALQLLLLVDYIFDWARDIYRDSIIQELRILASGENDTASIIYSDTDILSTRQVENSGFPNQEDIEEYANYDSGLKQYTALDSEEGIIRHATFIESRYCAIHITSDNVTTLLQSIRQTKVEKLCRLILNHMVDSIILDLATLQAMEEQWTGNSRLSQNGFLAQTKFYSVVSCTNFLSGSWQQVRELYIVAIAEDAWAHIVNASKLKRNRGRTERPSFAKKVNMASMLKTIERLQAGSLADTLLAAITRRAVKIKATSAVRSSIDMDISNTSFSGMADDSPVLCDVVADDGAFRDIVQFVYKVLKLGVIEPILSFLRISKRFDQQHLLHFDSQPIPHPEAPLQLSDSNCVLISSNCHSHDPERSQSGVCLYIVTHSPEIPTQEQLFEILFDTMETRDVYHTTQDNGTSNLDKNDVPWNIKRTYAIYSESWNFYRFLLGIGHKIGNRSIPAMQGSQRRTAGSGSYIFSRNLIPWNDRRLIGRDREARMFIIYKLMVSEVLYWRRKAERLNAKGIICCKICAGPTAGHRPTCFQCWMELDDTNEQWLENAIRGVAHFPKDDYDEADDDEDLDNSDSDSDQHDPWHQSLASYPYLDRKFGNLGELFIQWRHFQNWAAKRQQAKWERRGERIAKRLKRSREDRDEEESADESLSRSESEISD